MENCKNKEKSQGNFEVNDGGYPGMRLSNREANIEIAELFPLVEAHIVYNCRFHSTACDTEDQNQIMN